MLLGLDIIYGFALYKNPNIVCYNFSLYVLQNL